MPTITTTADSSDGWARNAVPFASGWVATQGDETTTGTGSKFTTSYYSFGVYNIRMAGRGVDTYYNARSFYEFDLSGESGTATSATFKSRMDHMGVGTGTEDEVIMVAATALAGSNADYGNVYSSGTTWGTAYSSNTAISTTLGVQTITLNAAAITAINSAIGSGKFICAMVGHYFDYLGNTPLLADSGNPYTKIRLEFSEAPASLRPILTTTTSGAAVTDNAVFFGANF
jgi:hypothetical protein